MATEVASAYVELGANTSKLSAGLAAAGAQVEGFAKKADARAATASAAFSKIGTAAKVGTLAVAGGLALAVKSAANFDAQMSQVKAVTGATAQQMGVLRKAALDTSKSQQGFGYTAKDVAAAQVELGKAGLSTAQIIGGGMQSALTLARAGNLDLADAAAYTANAMQQFGLSGQQSAQVADALAQAANATTADVSDFGAALVQTGAASKAAGLSFNETMTALTALAATGVKGSDAGTSLKTSLIQLVKPTDKQAEAAQRAGIAFLDQNKKMKDLASISEMLRVRTQNMGKAERTALFATLAGTDGVRTLLALYDAGPAKIAKYSAQLAKQGTAQSQAATMSDNAAGKFKELMATLQAAGIEIGTALLPPLAAIASGVAKVISKITAFKPLAYAAAAAITAMIAAFAVSKVIAFAGAMKQAAVGIGLVSSASTAASAPAAVGGLGVRLAASAASGLKFGSALRLAVGGAKGMSAASLGLAPGLTAAQAGLTKASGASALMGKGLAQVAGLAAFAVTPLGALTVGVGLGVAALFAFRNEASASERFVAGLGQATDAYKTKVQALNQLLPQQVALVRSAAASNKYASEAKREETAAVQAYNQALAAGRGAGETEAQFQQRLAGLYLAAANARVQTVDATTKSTDATRKAVDGAAKLATSGQQELQAARDRVAAAKTAEATAQRFNMSQQAQAKASAQTAAATANLTVVQARYLSGLKADERQLVATRNAVKASAMGDQEKAASLDIVNRAINKTRTAQQKFNAEKAPFKKITVDNKDATKNINNTQALMTGLKDKKVSVKADTESARANINPIVALLDRVQSKTITITAKKQVSGSLGVGGAFRGGFAQHLARGGKVTGPAGRDVIPAMLTSGEVVLTKAQQAMVDRGMSIRDAIRRTGGAYARGGIVGQLKDANATVRRRKAELKAANKSGNKDAIKKAKENLAAAEKRAADLKGKKDTRMAALAPGIEAVADAVKNNNLARFDRETQTSLRNIEKGFQGTFKNSLGQDVVGSLADADKMTEQNLKNIERNFKGTFVNAIGQTVTGSFRAFDIEMRKAQQSLTAMYDALTPAEAQIKALQDQASSQDISSAITDAQAKLREAQDFGDPAAVAAARKALDDAERAQTIAGLQTTAEAERTAREAARQQAQDDFDAEWEGKRTALQDQLDSQLETERLAGEARRTLLQEQLDTRLTQEQDARDQLRMEREIELEELKANLLAQRTQYLDNWKAIRAQILAFARRIRISGANIGKAIAQGIDDSKGDIEGAARGLAQILSDFLRTRSPSKDGPLSSLDTWWDGFTPALMSGMDTAAIEAGVASAVVAPTIRAGAGAGGDVTINLNVSDQTFAGMSREQADRVARQIQSALDRQVRASI